MIKKILAASVVSALAVGSASAATIYENNGFKYVLKGDWQVQLRQKIGEDKGADMEFDDLELKNRVTYSLSDSLSAFGQLDYSFDKEGNNAGSDAADGGRLEEAYLGLDFGDVVLRFGKQNYSTDEFSVEKVYETVVEDDAFDLNDDAGDDVIRVDADFDGVFVSVSTDIKAEGNSSSDNNQSFDVFVSTSIGDADFAAGYQHYQEVGQSTVDAWGVSAVFDAGFATFGADYSSVEDTADVYNLVAVIPVAATTKVALGIQNLEAEVSSDDVNGWYANITHQFEGQKNVSMFAEVSDTDEDNADPGYLAGMRLKF